MQTSRISQKDLLQAELDMRTRRAGISTSLNRWIGYLLVGGAIVSSFAAFFLSLGAAADASRIGQFAAFAGLMTAINAAFNFEKRANWFSRRVNALRRLKRKLLFPKGGEPDIPALAEELSDLLDQLSADFPAISSTEFKPAPVQDARNRPG